MNSKYGRQPEAGMSRLEHEKFLPMNCFHVQPLAESELSMEICRHGCSYEMHNAPMHAAVGQLLGLPTRATATTRRTRRTKWRRCYRHFVACRPLETRKGWHEYGARISDWLSASPICTSTWSPPARSRRAQIQGSPTPWSTQRCRLDRQRHPRNRRLAAG